MDIIVQYCGGCNSQIDRTEIVRNVETLLGRDYSITTDSSRAPFEIGLLVCGCPSACARKPELIAIAGRWITVTGKTINSAACPEDHLAPAVIQKIKSKD